MSKSILWREDFDRMANTRKSPASAVVSIAALGGLLWFYFGGGLEKQAAQDLRTIQTQVADDAIRQYNISSRSGSAMDRCVQAGFVAAALLQAQDEPRYAVWKGTEAKDCKAAGVPR